jgi:hypothetical protein
MGNCGVYVGFSRTFLLEILIFKGLTALRLYKSFGFKGLISRLRVKLYKKIKGACCWWRSWLRHCATSRKVAGSIPDGVIGIFH